MRYVRKELVLTTVTNSELTETSHIMELLSGIKEEGLHVRMVIVERQGSDFQDYITTHHKVKIEDVGEHDCKIAIYNPRNIMKKNIGFDEIREITVVANTVDLFKRGGKTNRFSLLDIPGLEDVGIDGKDNSS